MIDLQNFSYIPNIRELQDYVRNDLFNDFCLTMKAYEFKYKIDFSKCSWQPGWNLKFKKSGKTIATVYLHEGYFTVMVVVRSQEKDQIENELSSFSKRLQEIYHNTKEGMGQRWLMIDLQDNDDCYNDTLRLINIRYQGMFNSK